MSLRFNFRSIGNHRQQTTLFYYLAPFRDADKSEEVINIDETPSSRQEEKSV